MGYSKSDRVSSQSAEREQGQQIGVAQFADNRSCSTAQLQMQGMMHSSSQMMAQRKVQASIQSSATQQQAIQCVEDEELLQGKFVAEPTAQLEEKPNNTGLPNQLKAGIESLSGMSMKHVKVHYNSDKPAQLNAHAYAQGSDIHVATGQEQYLPHEAWHVIQQAQGRVKPTMQMKAGIPVNDDAGLEAEADVMGAKALGRNENTPSMGRRSVAPILANSMQLSSSVTQREVKINGKLYKKNATLPAIPPSITAAYEGYVIDKIKLHANKRRDLPKIQLTSATDEDFYKTLATEVINEPNQIPASTQSSDPWSVLKHKCKIEGGNVVTINWTEFTSEAGIALAIELKACNVQVSSNPNTTAFHGNKHHKLPRKVESGIAEMGSAEQAAATPYVEFLIPGHKNETGIERGIVDKELGLIYLTAHYDSGSFVRLSGAPADLIADWTAKAVAYSNPVEPDAGAQDV